MYVIVRDADDYDYSGPKGNIVNISRRRCRIGKVTLKTPRNWRPQTLPFPTPVKDDFTFRWPSLYGQNDIPAMCRQCIGKACGNVACPSRLTVTCNAHAEATA